MERDIKSDCSKWPVTKSWTQNPSQSSLVIRSVASDQGSEHMNIWKYSKSLLPEENSHPQLSDTLWSIMAWRFPSGSVWIDHLKLIGPERQREGHLSEGQEMGSNSCQGEYSAISKKWKILEIQHLSLSPHFICPSCLTLCMHCVEGWTWCLLDRRAHAKIRCWSPQCQLSSLITLNTPEIHLFKEDCTGPLQHLSDISVLQRSLLSP